MNIKTLFWATGYLFSTLPLWADGNEQTWTLQQCIDYALEHNIQLKQKNISVQQAEADVNQAKGQLLPSLSFSLTESGTYRPLQESALGVVTGGIATNSTNKLTGNGSYGLNASWTVWNGGINQKNVKQKEIAKEVSNLDADVSIQSIQEQILQLYVQILYSKEALLVNNQLKLTAESQHDRGKELFKQGQISKADLAQLEAQEASAAYNCVSMTTQIAGYKRQLKQLLEITDNVNFDIAESNSTLNDDELTLIIPSVNEVYKQALESRAEIKQSQLQSENAALDLKVARAGYYPTISINAGLGDSHYTGSNETIGEQLKQNLNAQAGITVSVPIFDNRKNKTNIKKAKLSILNSELETVRLKNELYSTIDKYHLDATNNVAQWKAASVKASSAQNSYELLDEQFKNGLKNITELLTGRDNLLQAKQDLLQSKYMALMNIALLNYYKGETLSF